MFIPNQRAIIDAPTETIIKWLDRMPFNNHAQLLIELHFAETPRNLNTRLRLFQARQKYVSWLLRYVLVREIPQISMIFLAWHITQKGREILDYYDRKDRVHVPT